ncbi:MULTISPECIES: hypothetical protein [unclassified Variovorax]|jgi:hypothetical protein|uniref:hypothetical protein n=1 Tax=unclassified Variovorax TaxID=663243 RepID=UPI000F7E722F|nr:MULTISPECIES: hypothetical protein [unclassified Variovorax]RSZ35107.1 hypothetical protein EJO70_24865 [Variovorax sp. 553]RSZ35875.1 hypothetical protein EJO71_25625 [Variovorax sp. 679]
MATRAASKSNQAMCCLTVGFVQILLPADAGLKVAALLRGAVDGHLRYDAAVDRVFEIQGEVDVEYCAIKAGQVRMPKPPTASPAPLAIGREPLKLTHG